MSARPGPRGGYRVSGIPTAISKPLSMREIAISYLLLHLFWFADRAALEAMDQSLPPGPALFLRLMLILQPSRLGQLFSNFWVTYSHSKTP
jgi:hypothetical protein